MLESITDFWNQAFGIWLSGGWGMIALAVNGLFMFSLGMRVHFRLSETGYKNVPESKWRRWIDHPEERQGPIGEMVAAVADAETLKQIDVYFEEVRTAEIMPFDRDLRVMKVCVSASPLLGLLGTVTGMLATFAALATGGGGDQTMGMVASGISEALITTETGLVFAIPGLFFQYKLARESEQYKVFLAHLQTVCTQKVYRAQK